MSFENPTQTSESAPVPTLIQMPDHIIESRAQAEAVSESQHALDVASAHERAEAVARSINDTRPEGMPETLPTGEKKEYGQFGASTVNSHSGIRIDTPE
ncbi:MAG: hypothetical protein JWM52_723 [Candidatus Saccharibacteria bacterium]|nr:hypothetical protein [Candidatus Saccharibacteria bacterium]